MNVMYVMNVMYNKEDYIYLMAPEPDKIKPSLHNATYIYKLVQLPPNLKKVLCMIYSCINDIMSLK